MKKSISDKNILVGVTGSIAAYKTCELVRLLVKEKAAVKVIMTRNAERFVGKLTFQTLSRNKVLTGMFDEVDEWVPEHIELSEWADILLVAPATANIIGKCRGGIADDLLSSTIISTNSSVVFAPAMNVRMYENQIVQEGIEDLKRKGCYFIGPEKGFLADGCEGKGRMTGPKAILEFLSSLIPE